MIPPKERMKYIGSNVLTFLASKGGNKIVDDWELQRDAMQTLDAFERATYKITRSIYLIRNNNMVTLDDDVYGTWAKDNQVKPMSSRKIDKEGCKADIICNALFRFTRGILFKRRIDSQTVNIEN